MTEQLSTNNIIEILKTTENKLKERSKNEPLSEKNANLLNAIENGAWGDGIIGTFLNGLFVGQGAETLSAIKEALNTLSKGITLRGNVGGIVPERNDAVGTIQSRFGDNFDLSTYDVSKALEQKAINETRKETPLLALGTEVMGSVPTALMTPNKMALAHPFKTAMGSAGLYGFGEGGDDATNLEESLIDRTSNAITTAPFGAVGLAGTNILKNVGGSLYSSLKNPVGAGVKAARDLVKKHIKAEGLTFDEAIKYVLDNSGKKMTIADIGNSPRYLLNAANIMGSGSSIGDITKFLRDRANGRVTRLKDDLWDALGKKGRFFSEFQAIKKARSYRAKPLYEKAFKIDIGVNDQLASIINKIPSSVVNRAKRLANLDGVNIGNFKIVNGKLLTENGDEVVNISSRFLHYLQEGLRDSAQTIGRKGSGTEAFKIGEVHRDLFEHIRNANSFYRRASDLYAGDSAVMRAMELGKKLFRQDEDELKYLLQKMNPSEKEGFRNGALNELVDILDNANKTGNVANKLIRSTKQENLLRMTFPPTKKGKEAFEKFWKNLQKEQDTYSTEAIVQHGSKSAISLEVMSNINKAAAKVFTGNESLYQALSTLLRRNAADATQEQIDVTTNEIVKILTATGKKKLEQITNELNEGGGILQATAKHAPNLLTKVNEVLSSPYVSGQLGARLQDPASNLATGIYNFGGQMRGLLQ